MNAVKKAVTVEWKSGPGEGDVEVANGRLEDLRVTGGNEALEEGRFSCPSGPACLELTVDSDERTSATIVTVRTDVNPLASF